jgi:2-keto-4-pentenoate hydratase
MSDAITQYADLLIAARRDPAQRIVDLPDALRPRDLAAALAVQYRVAATFGPIGGWKVGAPGGIPVSGALPTPGIVPSPVRLSSADHPYRGIEAEVAFRIGRDLPPRPQPYDRDEIVAALATLHPAIEVLETRFANPSGNNLLTNVADTQMHGGLVYGSGRADWQAIDLAAERCEQYVDGALQKHSVGYPFGDIVALVGWLANVGSVWAGGLRAGQFVTCGSWTGAERVGPSARVRVTFASLGEARVDYTA